MRSLLIKGADPNKCDIEGRSPLMYCANNTQGLTLLLRAGADPNQVDWLGYSTLCYLVMDADDTNCADILITWGADLNLQKRNISAIGQTVGRRRPRILKWLLDHDVELERRQCMGETPLLQFLSNNRNGSPDMLEMLLEKKPKCLARNDYQEGWLHYLARFGESRYMNIFRQKADLSDIDTEQKSINGIGPRGKCYPGMTALELAEWRRDHQAEWAYQCSMSPDPDPTAWFAAFTSFIESIKAAQVLKLRNEDKESTKASSSTPGNEIGPDVSARVDPQVFLRVPGAYPQE